MIFSVSQGRWLAALVSLTVLSGAHVQSIADSPQLIVLGVAQDGGFPQAGCQRECCREVWNDPSLRRWVSCLALVDPQTNQRFMLDCTPDFRDQLRLLDRLAPTSSKVLVDGILPTHAHVGHYTGLMHLGREVIGAQSVPVFAMPRMKHFLESNGPWQQLVQLNQIHVRRLAAGQQIALTQNLSVTPIPVPHRDEYSETVGFMIHGPSRSALYIPDIDKWERWELEVETLISQVDLAFLDGTFFDAQELPGRDLSEIPHPLVIESVRRFGALPAEQRAKIYFIHLNHSNPLLRDEPTSLRQVHEKGLRVAEQASVFDL